MTNLRPMRSESVVAAYSRWAPVYDQTFGRLTTKGREAAVERVNALKPGRVLEVGVGTGIALPLYDKRHRIVGIDLSEDMLKVARRRVERNGLSHVEAIRRMDAGALEFEDASFDHAIAMFVITVVPDPERVMRELARVVRPGGRVLLVNHFSRDEGDRSLVAHAERVFAPFGEKLGWRPIFPVDVVSDENGRGADGALRLESRGEVKPFGLFSLISFERIEADATD